jgi:hypothetical protein
MLWYTRTAPKAPTDLACYVNLYVQLLRKGPHQTGIFLKHPTYEHNIKPLLKQLVRLFTAGDTADSANGQLAS